MHSKGLQAENASATLSAPPIQGDRMFNFRFLRLLAVSAALP
jgi:hypothetical protein